MDKKEKSKISLWKVKLNSQGYDKRGFYYGVGQPLYHYYFETENEIFGDDLRALDRKDAKEKIIYLLKFRNPDIEFSFTR